MPSIKQVLDAQLAAQRASTKKAVLRPRGPRYEVGDGDPCPGDPARIEAGETPHGRMVTIPGTKKQYCPHQSHDGKGGEGHTRAIWPLEDMALARAVAETRVA